ncbi:MAG: Flp pilus assembly complex ATPase component TadA [Planctomycetaceae bacterium]|jgi:type IV pilus assembly protein PilB|nr:Flp pilus assembly complex ATPase component TadA [Planctomycetaceae bacterium]
MSTIRADEIIAAVKGARLGRVLRKFGKVTREQVHEALTLQQGERKGQLIGNILVELGYITPEDLLAGLAAQRGFAFVNLDGVEIPQEVVDALKPETATAFGVVPIEFEAATRKITIVLKSPENFQAVDDLKQLLGFKVTAVVAKPEQVDKVLREKYAGRRGDLSAAAAAAANSAALAGLSGRGDSVDIATLASAANDNAVVELVQSLLMMAIRDKASDIHFEPFEDEFKVRYRIDGVLYDMLPMPKGISTALVSRVKVMSKLDIAERRLPQDGRIELHVGAAPIDLRVAVLPTMFGESVVLRVLDRSNVQLSLDRIGLRPDDLEKFRTIINKPNGIVVVTGPTGSGKTTTLYAALNELNDPGVKILTAEDPVEYDVAGLIQCQVNLDQELTFAKLLRSFLRQDPDIILVGEIRDLETAQIAIQASLTGHLVLTTLHTNDAPSTILRLVDLGVETFLLTATIEAIVAQRLVRRICTNCKQPFSPTEEQVMELGLRMRDIEGRQFYRGKGCDNCLKSGYKGRMALFEIMSLDDEVRDLVMKQASTAVLRQEAKKRGMRTLREVGLLSIFDGQTTIDEVVRETLGDE